MASWILRTELWKRSVGDADWYPQETPGASEASVAGDCLVGLECVC